jgi:hypothetical protein
MRTSIVASAACLTLVAVGPATQRTTEIFVPIGRSPGVSNVSSIIGSITAYDASARTLTITVDGAAQTAELIDETKIWLDRSAAKQTNQVGTPGDLQPGRRCEVKFAYEGEARTSRAEWIKVDAGGATTARARW